MSAVIPHKRGDTFILDATLSDGGVVDMSTWSVLAQVRAPGGALVATLALEWTDRPAGAFRLSAANTAGWPLALLDCDIQYTLPSGQIASTETVQIDCQRDISQ